MNRPAPRPTGQKENTMKTAENTAETAMITAAPAAENNLMTVNKALSYCSFDTSTNDGKARLFNAMSKPDERIADHINEEVTISDLYAEMIDITDDKTGEITTAPRIIIIDPNGISYAAVSTGVYGDIKRILQIFGEPSTWAAPIKVKVKQVPVKKGSMLKLQLLG